MNGRREIWSFPCASFNVLLPPLEPSPGLSIPNFKALMQDSLKALLENFLLSVRSQGKIEIRGVRMGTRLKICGPPLFLREIVASITREIFAGPAGEFRRQLHDKFRRQLHDKFRRQLKKFRRQPLRPGDQVVHHCAKLGGRERLRERVRQHFT